MCFLLEKTAIFSKKIRLKKNQEEVIDNKYDLNKCHKVNKRKIVNRSEKCIQSSGTIIRIPFGGQDSTCLNIKNVSQQIALISTFFKNSSIKRPLSPDDYNADPKVSSNAHFNARKMPLSKRCWAKVQFPQAEMKCDVRT
ncbi:hypothetical protein CEXT_752711 [Caerostris extrusa]|uniref:Uncharacterized protein n=1 Tax=Caerostris extrusa TaxID=172846 RepID=A0AAV4WV19_CAEEX|nr:hypothetical protein CEXT_752711 [Caerostris extrusa]